ncbi:MAG: homocysteine S-methyltransferase family protein [Planctomycetes bacterium]|nr:homocysteine S-methyltransferase family protein [Planctomycetota bacterium]
MAGRDLWARIRRDLFLLDGAMGTQLFARGAQPGKCNDWFNVESPDVVMEIHRAYFDAGSDAVLTNTFGANRYALARHGYADGVSEINLAGAQVARKAAGEQRYVLGDIGPTGDFLEPVGTLRIDQVREAYVAQVRGLREGGVDGFIIETMTALDELSLAIEAARSAGDDLPVFASMSFDKGSAGFRTMMGVDVPMAVSKMVALGVDAVGFNCGTASLEEYVELAGAYVTAARSSRKKVLVFAEPNAGKPELVDGRAVYQVAPAEFAAACGRILKAGIHILGGCCGTGPEHIRAVAEALKA